ncbi:MAG: transposase [Bacteroidetes bacterium GWF2_33_16]|nr:MAG: transposase [Bacteroidetes bacterium GWE2_32_14]OFY04145.1 MAG: transposase [Bacteroidetes bacterium GWF2_33_16]
MSFIRIWIHCVWGTKNREALFNKDNKAIIINHIKDNAKRKGIYIDCINGGNDHLHCLISLNPNESLSKTVQLIKGESSYWINKSNLVSTKFEWGDEYFAISVSESSIQAVREYIRNQEEHHKKKTWTEEYKEFIQNYNFDELRAKAL